MSIETLDDITEEIANLLGVYGDCTNADNCPCRMCWEVSFKDRVREAVRIEAILAAAKEPKP